MLRVEVYDVMFIVLAFVVVVVVAAGSRSDESMAALNMMQKLNIPPVFSRHPAFLLSAVTGHWSRPDPYKARSSPVANMLHW